MGRIFVTPNSKQGRRLRAAKGTGGKSDIEQIVDRLTDAALKEIVSSKSKEHEAWNAEIERKKQEKKLLKGL